MSTGPIKLRRRADLIATPQPVGWSRRWAIKDPISLEYYHLGEQEWFLFQQLDGRTSLEDIQDRFARTFTPQRISTQRLMAFLKQLHENGMLLADQFGQGDVAIERSTRQRRKQWRGQALSPLAIRFPGVDASSILDWLRPLGNVLFHPLFALQLFVAWVAALTLVIAQADVFARRVPSLSEFFTGWNLFLLVLTLSVVKFCHELGHGLACRRFGGECHEIGVMLLALTPCLYCNVSDAWMMPKRSHRMIVSAAGIYVELMLAVCALFLWYFSIPGTFNMLSLNTVLICTLSTVLFNGNPLLRYDGYFILADALNAPNLFEQSRQAMWSPLKDWLRGVPSERQSWDIPKPWLIAYAILSSVYRIFVIGVILWFLYRWFTAINLRPLADMIVAVTLLGVMSPISRFAAEVHKTQYRSGGVPWSRWIAFLVIGLLAGVALFIVPAPRRIRAPVVIQSANAEYVYVPFAGQLMQSLRPGDQIAARHTIATLRNSELQQELIDARSETQRLARELENLRFQSNQDAIARSAVPTVAAALEAAQNRQLTIEANIERLTIASPRDGVLISGPYVAAPQTLDDLPSWEECPLNAENQHCFVEAGDLLCLVGEPGVMEALVLVQPRDINLVSAGDAVSLRIDQIPGQVIGGTVVEISRGEIPLAGWSQRGETDPEIGLDGNLMPRATSHFLRVQLDDPLTIARHGSGGFAKIDIDEIPLGTRCIQYLRTTFQFKL